MPHFLDLATATPAGLRAILDDAHARKAARAGWPKGQMDADAPLAGHVLGMIFEKPSTRTRFSFDMGARQLGATTIVSSAGEMQLGRGETVADLSHPCQVMADIMTFEERAGRPVTGSTWAYVGDGNNMTNSLIEASSLLKFDLKVGVPHGLEPDSGVMATACARGGCIDLVHSAEAAVEEADVVVTDTWVSMGQADTKEKMAACKPFQVNDALMAKAAPGALFLHCLPAHRNDEVTDSVMDGPASAVWDEAENRLHVQKSILLWCLGKL